MFLRIVGIFISGMVLSATIASAQDPGDGPAPQAANLRPWNVLREIRRSAGEVDRILGVIRQNFQGVERNLYVELLDASSRRGNPDAVREYYSYTYVFVNPFNIGNEISLQKSSTNLYQTSLRLEADWRTFNAAGEFADVDVQGGDTGRPLQRSGFPVAGRLLGNRMAPQTPQGRAQDITDDFAMLQQSYVFTLPAVYSAIEHLRRVHVYPGASAPLTPRDKENLKTLIAALHTATQFLMGWMDFARDLPEFADFIQDRNWEDTWGIYYDYDKNPAEFLDAVVPLVSTAPYFVPIFGRSNGRGQVISDREELTAPPPRGGFRVRAEGNLPAPQAGAPLPRKVMPYLDRFEGSGTYATPQRQAEVAAPQVAVESGAVPPPPRPGFVPPAPKIAPDNGAVPAPRLPEPRAAEPQAAAGVMADTENRRIHAWVIESFRLLKDPKTSQSQKDVIGKMLESMGITREPAPLEPIEEAPKAGKEIDADEIEEKKVVPTLKLTARTRREIPNIPPQLLRRFGR